MSIRFYNTLTRTKEEFKPLRNKEVRIYSCGPTVYDYPHIGNLRAFAFYDLLRRYLKYRGYKVKHVMNITDVDDKTIRNSKKEGIPLSQFTEKYTKIFFEDLEKINVEKFEYYPKATEHIKEMVEMIKILMKKGLAYKGADGSIYFNIRKFPSYGKLSKLDLSGLKDGARVSHDEYSKEEAKDFALWKAWTPEDGDVYWETEIGKGRPGWHIECSVMSTKYLGKTFDIHTGGVDLIFPHHENEIAQSEGANGVPPARFWMHNEHVMVEGQKMSKSLGNYFTLNDLIKRGHDPRAIRYTLISTHYRSKLNVTDKSLWAAKQAIDKIDNFMDLLKEVKGKKTNEKVNELIKKVKKEFVEAMDDDLDITKALASIFNFIREINKLIEEDKIGKKDAENCIKVMEDFDRVLGILKIDKAPSKEIVEKLLDLFVEWYEDLKEKDEKSAKNLEKLVGKMKGEEFDPKNFDKLMQVAIEIRNSLRKKKEYDLSDKIRADLREIRIILEDKEDGTRWRIL
ncbi:MAG: cysteine--tRNA ligase [Candidatus Aenigmatarchaeota archaeon]